MTNQEKTLFLIECSAPHWIEVAQNLRKHHIKITYWSGWSRIQPEVATHVKEAIFHDTFHAKIGLDPRGKTYPFESFDEICDLVWKKEAQTVYDMMNRFDHSRDQTFVERSTLFAEHLCYWRKVLKQHNPSLVLFSTPPHVVYDYILLALCRALNIPTLMYEEATIYPPYCLAMTDYLAGSVELAAQSRHQHTISATTTEIVARIRGSYQEAKPAREVIAHKAMELAINEGLSGLQTRVDTVKKIDNDHKGLYEINEKIVNTSSAYKQKGKHLRKSFAAPYANSLYMDQLMAEHSFTNEMREYYHRNTTPLENIAQPFVYVALAGQPERTSNPQAGIFTNQLLMVNMIAHALPEGWAVVVREHPNQFHPEFAVNMCRNIEYYDALLRLPNCRLLSTYCEPFSVIDRCQLAATSGGTTALEAVARGKPALLFGDAWYRDCPGVYRINSITEISTVLNGSLALNPGDFVNYVEAITKGCFRGLADYPPADYPVSQDENVINLTQTILTAIS